MNCQALTRHLTGSTRDSEQAMRVARTDGACPMVEHMPLSQATQALGGIHQGAPRFRIVLDPAGDQ